jgi:hypothetical protein
MKQETNNEMDLLLRRLGGRPETSVSDANGDVDHLDADELSAYAENVLPAAARARYTGHLAECARCRELVVQLSSSAGVVPVAEVVRPTVPSALRKFLASLFSPMVLRYAVPALGLIVIAAIGLFVSRPKQGNDTSIAQKTEAPTSTSITTNTPDPSSPAAKTYYDQQTQQQAAKPAQSSGSPTSESAGAAPVAPVTTDQVAETPRDAAGKKQEQQPVANEAPPAPKPATPTDESKKRPAEVEAGKQTATVQVTAESQTAKTVDTVKVEDRKTAAEIGKARSDADRAQTFGAASAGVVARSRTQAKDDEEKDKRDGGETRTIAGRHFRKKDNAWIDSAYDSSRPIVTYTRGSEAYRSLTADEPAIKTIAEKLDGEVIVVWKGRTYRIK